MLKNINQNKPQCPHLKIVIQTNTDGVKEVWALVDSGSYITCISDDFYKMLLVLKKVYELPVTNVVVSVAVGKKATIIKKHRI